MKKRIAKKIINVVGDFINWDTDRQPYTIPQQRKAFKILQITKLNLIVYGKTKRTAE